MPLRPDVVAPDVEALDGAAAGRGANGAAGPPIGRAGMAGAARAPLLPEFANGAALVEGSAVLTVPEPTAPGALSGGRMKGGGAGRVAAPCVGAGVVDAMGAATRAGCALGGVAGVTAVAGVAVSAGIVAGTAGTAAGEICAWGRAGWRLTALATAGAANSSRPPPAPAIVITPPQTEHRARATAMGIFAGSTRNTERHSGQVTFMPSPPWGVTDLAPECASRPQADCRSGDPRSRPIRAVSSHSSSFPSPTRLPVPHA